MSTASSASTTVVLRALGLGDLVTGLPALHLLRDARPDDRVLLAAPARFVPLIQRLGVVDDVIDTAGLYAPLAVTGPVQLAVDLHGNGPESRDLLAALDPTKLLAYSDGAVTWRRDEHEVARWLRLVRDGMRTQLLLECGVPGVLGPAPPTERPHCTVVHIGAGSPSRRWDAGRFATVALLLSAEGRDVVVVGGPGDAERAAHIARAADVTAETGLSLTDLAGLVGAADLVVSGDTGIAHLAAAYERPSVTLFGPVSPLAWGPPPHARHRVIFHGDGDGDPHGEVIDPALARVTVGEVIAAVHAVSRVPSHHAY